MSTALDPSVWADLEAVTLDEMDDVAALRTRIDRKYVVSAAHLPALLDRIAGMARVLEIDGRRSFRYESVYFDTPDHLLHRQAAWRRPGRFKVRTRTYVDTGSCNLELKQRSRSGHNVKHRTMHDGRRPRELDDDALGFLRRFVVARPLPRDLMPTLTTRYVRTTLLVGVDQRVTIDIDVTGTDGEGRCASFGPHVVLETKSPGRHGPVDIALWTDGHRPLGVSKYSTSLAAICAELPRNRWSRVIARYVTTHPTG